jgi:hypothetical protein
MADDGSALFIAVLVFLVVLVAVHIAIRLRLAHRHERRRRADHFLGEFYYRPSCGSCYNGVSSCGHCRITSGRMPAIETAGGFGCDGGCGRLGVPP